MFVAMAMHRSANNSEPAEGGLNNQRGAAVVEWLGISALSVALLVVIFRGMEDIGLSLVDSIRSQLGL